MKICTRCKIEQPFENFQKSCEAPDGHQYRCRSCNREVSKELRARRGHLWKQGAEKWKNCPENRERRNASARARRAKNPEKQRRENRSYREQNPYGTAVSASKDRAKKLNVLSTLTVDEWKAVVEEHDFMCHLCGGKVSFEIGSDDRLSLDHIVPMSKKGTNTKDNVAPAHALCNRGRLDMTMEEFDNWITRINLFKRKSQCQLIT